MSIAPTDTLTAADHAALDALYRPAGDCLDGLTTLGGAPAAIASAEPSKPPKADPLSVRKLMHLYPALRPPVIHGLIRRGETINIIAPPKTGKSWLVTDLAIAVATGRMWLGHQTERGDVLILDNELHGETSAARIPKVAAARGILVDEFADHVFVENLRGKLRNVFEMQTYFEAIEPGRFKAIILDAYYRFLPRDTDENDNGSVASIYSKLDSYADRLGCCFVLIHHASKGNQSEKSVTDVGAGAGSQARATDTHLVLRQHDEDGVVVMDAAVRSWAPINPACLRWSFPVWNVDGSLDPTHLRRAGKQAKRKEETEPAEPEAPWTMERFVAEFITDTPRAKPAILVKTDAAKLSERKADRLLKAAVESESIYEWTFGNQKKPHKFATIPQPLMATESGVSGE